MSLFGTKEKQEIAVLQNEIAALKAQLTPEHITLAELNQEIEASRVTLETVYKSVVEKKALLKGLEEPDKTLFSDGVVYNHPYGRIAQKLGMSENNVAVRIFRLKGRLQKCLDA